MIDERPLYAGAPSLRSRWRRGVAIAMTSPRVLCALLQDFIAWWRQLLAGYWHVMCCVMNGADVMIRRVHEEGPLGPLSVTVSVWGERILQCTKRTTEDRNFTAWCRCWVSQVSWRARTWPGRGPDAAFPRPEPSGATWFDTRRRGSSTMMIRWRKGGFKGAALGRSWCPRGGSIFRRFAVVDQFIKSNANVLHSTSN